MQKPFRAECIMRMSTYSNERFAEGRKMNINKKVRWESVSCAAWPVPICLLQRNGDFKGAFRNGDFVVN